MAYSVFQAFITDGGEAIVAAASVAVVDEATGLDAQLYDGPAGSPILNPTTSGVDGLVRFYLPAGKYKITVTKGSLSKEFRHWVVGEAGSKDVGVAGGVAPLDGFNQVPAAHLDNYYTKSEVDGLVVGLLDDRGNYDASSNLFPSSGGSGPAGAIKKGDIWNITVAGTLGGTAVDVNDWVRALTDAPGQTAGNWAINKATGGGAGGGTVRDWDLTPVASPAVLTLATLPGGFPITNEGVVVGSNLSVPVADDAAPHFGAATFGALPATGKAYFYWQYNAPAGVMASQQAAALFGAFDAPAGGVAYDGTGLLNTAGGALIDAAFAPGDVALIYVDVDAGTVGVKTPNGDFPAFATTPGLAGLVVGTYSYGEVSGGAGTLSSDTAVTDFGSGLTPPVGYSPIQNFSDAALPVGSAAGDTLNVTVAGTWAAIPYAVGDGAVVTNTAPAAVLPAGTTSAALAALGAQKVTSPTFGGFTATVGTGQTFATLDALRDHIAANVMSGDVLTIDLYPGATDGASEVRASFPTFRRIFLNAGGTDAGSFDFGAASVSFLGSPSNLYIFGSLTLTTTSNFISRYGMFGAATISCAGLELHDFHTSSTTFNQADGGSPILDGMLPGEVAAASMTINYTGGGVAGSVYATVTGKIGYLTVTANVRAYAESGTAAGLTWNYSGGDLTSPLNPVVLIAGGAHVRVAQINHDLANIDTALAVAAGGVASIEDTGGTNIIGTGAVGRKFSQGPNRATMDGLIMAEGAWVAPTLLNSWANITSASWAPSGYRHIGNTIELRGAVQAGTAVVIFTLPASLCPAYDHTFCVPVHDNTVAPDYGHLIVRTTGDVELEHMGSLSNHKAWLDGIQIPLT